MHSYSNSLAVRRATQTILMPMNTLLLGDWSSIEGKRVFLKQQEVWKFLSLSSALGYLAKENCLHALIGDDDSCCSGLLAGRALTNLHLGM